MIEMHTPLLIIGAGPGGYETALLAARRGMETTVIEAAEVGGTCLNAGCIPTKALCRSAEIAEEFSKAGQFGFTAEGWKMDFQAVMRRKNEVVGQLRGGVETLLGNPKTRLVRGKARFTDAHTVEAGGETFTAENIIIATGSVPAALPISGNGLPGVLTSTGLLDIEEVPRRLCVIGAGVIGLELASVFSAFGSEVTVLEYAKEVLPRFDTDIAKRLRQALGKRGIEIATQAEVTGITAGNGTLAVAYTRKGKECSAEADKVLMAVGRRPNLGSLNLDEIGIAYTKKGITVDGEMRTNIPHIYAIGDINGINMLAHVATAQGVRALNAICGEIDRMRLDVVPSAVFTMPEAATVGLTEDDCKERGIGFNVTKSFFRANGKAVCMGETEGLCKLVSDSDGKLIGCHILGAHSADLVQEAAALITAGAAIDDLKRTIHAHPTLSEVVHAAAE